MRHVTWAVALVGLAVPAVTGCVTVRGDAVPQRPADSGASARETAPERRDAGAEPRMVRPSVRETLSRPRPAPEFGGPPDTDGTRREATGRPDRGVPPAGGARDATPEPRDPVVRSPRLPRGDAGVCDLGRRYGGWAEGSAQARACERTYGN